MIALDPLPVQSIGKTELVKKGESGDVLILEDENGLQIFFNRISKKISLEDSRLITNNSDFKEFMSKFTKDK